MPMDPDKVFCVGSLHPQDSCFQSSNGFSETKAQLSPLWICYCTHYCSHTRMRACHLSQPCKPGPVPLYEQSLRPGTRLYGWTRTFCCCSYTCPASLLCSANIPAKEIGLFDVCGSVTVATVSEFVVVAALPQHHLIL